MGVDDDHVAGFKFVQVSKDLSIAERPRDVPGDRGGARLARYATAAIPKCRMPDRIANKAHRRVHSPLRRESNSKHGGVDF